jgi:hypothetical protein
MIFTSYKNQTDIHKLTLSEIKNKREGIHSKIDQTKQRMREFKDRLLENTQLEEKRIKKTKEVLQTLK